MREDVRGKRNGYVIAFAVVIALAVPLSELKGRLSADAIHLLYGVLIGLALVFLAAAARSLRRPIRCDDSNLK